MKKLLVLSSAVLLSAGTIWMTGCKKDDTSPPVVSLTGSDPMSISLNTATTDPGATASDDQDGDITSSITSDWATKVNVNLKGTYTVTYSVSDAAGNTGTATRTVNVKNDAEWAAGSYVNVADTCVTSGIGTFNATITTSNTVNNKVTVNNFGGFGTTVNVDATVTSSTITFALPQSLGGTASLTSGNGTVYTTASPVKFKIIYGWTDGASNDTCTDWYVK